MELKHVSFVKEQAEGFPSFGFYLGNETNVIVQVSFEVFNKDLNTKTCTFAQIVFVLLVEVVVF